MPFTIPNLADATFPAQASPDSGDFGILVAAHSRSGVLSGCAVTAATTLHVSVAAGVVVIAGIEAAVTASAALTIGTADATNPRFDLIYTLAAGTPAVAAGTAATNPVYPSLPASSVILAAVYIPATLTTILSTHITDKRVMLDDEPGWVIYGGTPGSTAAASANITAWTAAVAAVPPGGTLFVKSGTYYTNGNLNIDRSFIHVLAEPGAAFKLVPGTNMCMMTCGSIAGTPTRTDITIEGLEFDGSCVLQDMANTPTTNDSSVASMLWGFQNVQIASTTNTTNATITVTNAGWTTNQWAGQLCCINSGSANGLYLVITSNTATVLTLTGVFATAPSAADTFVIQAGVYNRAVTSVTNTTNATLTVTGASWGTTRFVGMYANFITGPAAGTSKLITSHTATVLTLSGTYASTPVATNLFEICTQPIWTSAGWEAAFGQGAIVSRDCYRWTVKNCYIHDLWGTGITTNQNGACSITENMIDNVGLQSLIGPGNSISIAYGSANDPPYPSHSIVVSNNRLRRMSDVGIDIHGTGTYGVSCVGNSIYQCGVGIGGACGRYGIMVEIESADSSPNIGTVVSGNNIEGVGTGIAVANSGNNVQYFAAMALNGNVISNSACGISAEGAHLNITGNVLFLVGIGITANNATTSGIAIERDWTISGNNVSIDPAQIGFGACGVFLRWQPTAATATIATITGTTGNAVSPIVLTMSGGWSGTGQPAVGAVINVVGVGGNTAAIGAWVVQAVTATTVTLAQSTGNGAWTSGGTIQMASHMLDAVTITGNTFQGQGAALNQSVAHSGVYVEALPSGTSNASINHVNITGNSIHGFYCGVIIQTSAVNSSVSGVEIRANRIWNCGFNGVYVNGTQIRGTVIEDNNLSQNVTGSIAGLTTGAYKNTSNVDVVRNNRGHNPKGLLTLPLGSIVATPITTTVYTNDTGYDCMVYILGTISVISVGGNATGLTATTTVGPGIRVPVGQTLAITGSASLSWKWFAD